MKWNHQKDVFQTLSKVGDIYKEIGGFRPGCWHEELGIPVHHGRRPVFFTTVDDQ